MNARYYDPSNSRFISQDTYRGEEDDPMTWNLYAYCANNPINYIDPSGHAAIMMKSPFFGNGIGHSGLLLSTGKHKWYYFSWGLNGYKQKSHILRKVKLKKNKKYTARNLIESVNQNIRKKDRDNTYNQYIKIKGNKRKSYKYAKKIKAGEAERTYFLTRQNCVWMAIQVLRKGERNKTRKRKLWDIQYKKVSGHRNGSNGGAYSYIDTRTVVPNTAMKIVAKIYGAKIHNV